MATTEKKENTQNPTVKNPETQMAPSAQPGAQPPAAPPAAMNQSERFTAKVMKEFGTSVGTPELAEYHKKLVQGYFIAIDRALKTAEEERLRKNAKNRDHKWDNDLPVTWQNVNLADLATDVVHYARIGLDMMQDNHLFPIPYKNNKTNKYDVTLMEGYNGIRYISEKYALDKPISVTIELVYSSDTFRPIKKSNGQTIESYEFVINNAFDRGTLLGGFGYIEFTDRTKNKLIIMTMADVEKRKPKYASPNFWGGVIEDKAVEGWKDEMVYKTLVREVYKPKHIPLDPQKIDDNYQYMKLRETRIAELAAQADADMNACGKIIDTEQVPPAALPDTTSGIEMPLVDTKTGELVGAPVAQPDNGGPDF